MRSPEEPVTNRQVQGTGKLTQPVTNRQVQGTGKTTQPVTNHEVQGTGKPTQPVTNHESDADGAPASMSSFSDTAWGMSRRDRDFIVVVSAIILVSLSARLIQIARPRFDTVEIDRSQTRNVQFQLDMNTATWVEWMQLEGIGEATARRIVEHRETHGPFRTVDDIDNISGIGPATMAKIRPHLRDLNTE